MEETEVRQKDGPEVSSISEYLNAWFLGPKSENAQLLGSLVTMALDHHIHWRANYWPQGEPIITEEDKLGEAYVQAVAKLRHETRVLLDRLKEGFPFYSPRYLAHMLHDVAIPALLGYFSGMLFNANNVTYEAAPVTTEMENEVAQDLARLLGFEMPQDTWGHITSGGTVANLEALWVARNLKYFPVTMAEFCRRNELSVPVEYGGMLHLLEELDAWSLLNLRIETIYGLRSAVLKAWAEKKGQQLEWKQLIFEVDRKLMELDMNPKTRGLASVSDRLRELGPPAVLAPQSRHYCIDKALDLLGIGTGNLVAVDVDKQYRMNVSSLRKKLEECAKASRPVIALIAVVGSTEEGAVDPLQEILRVKKAFEDKKPPLTFLLHVDAAYGGYARSIFLNRTSFMDWNDVNEIAKGRLKLEADGEFKRIPRDAPFLEEMGDWPDGRVYAAFEVIGCADSVAVDPHKLGFVPYAAGAIVFRSKRVKDVVRWEAPYIFPEGTPETDGVSIEPFIGRYILEGSKPGAAAAACWLAHRCIPLDIHGYGAIIAESVRAANTLFDYLNNFGSTVFRLKKKQVTYKVMPICKPDLNIVCFAVGDPGASRPLSVAQVDDLNDAIFRRFSIEFKERRKKIIYSQPFWLSRSFFDTDRYSLQTHIAPLLHALGADLNTIPSGPWKLTYLRAAIMDPWISTSSPGGVGGLEEFVELLDDVISDELQRFRA
jgi:glutamate/tyrosine decarboxylase-like PLP-dependent enzyme